MKRRFAIALLLSADIAAVPAIAEQPLDLKLKLKAMTSYNCVMETEQDIVQTVNDQDRKLGQEMLQSWRYDVVGVNDDGGIELRLTCSRIKISQNYGFQTSEYDSDSPPDYIEPFMRGYGVLVGSELLITVTPKGRVTEIVGADSLFERIIAELDLPDSPRKDEIIDGMRNQFGETAMRQSIEQIFGYFPESAVVTGQEWSSEKQISSGIPLRVVDDYTLKTRQGGIAFIDVTSAVTSHPQGRPVQLGPVEMIYEVQGSHRGFVKVDELTGLPLESEIRMDLSGTVKASGVEDEDQEIWPMRSTGSVRVAFEKITD